jgi:hypothetical protein
VGKLLNKSQHLAVNSETRRKAVADRLVYSKHADTSSGSWAFFVGGANMSKLLVCLAPVFLLAAQEKGSEETSCYLRISEKAPATECAFTISRGTDGWEIRSVTGRGDVKLTVTARYDAKDQLRDAEAVLIKGDTKKTCRVEVSSGKAKVKREGQDAQEFEVPAGVIVTSAPDWTDTFLLCRRHDRTKAGKQETAGLWIHPEQPAQRLTFSVEKQGADRIEHAGAKLELDRVSIRIRGNTPYTGWIDAKGRMIKLMQTGTPLELVLEGFEKAVGELKLLK